MVVREVYFRHSAFAQAAEALKLTAADLAALSVIDDVVGEPLGGAHNDWDAAACALREALSLPRQQLQAIGESARRRAEDHFSARQFARRIADVLRAAALEGRSP